MSDAAPKKPVKTATTGTVFDVKRPGRAPLQSTSRPLIVGHKSVVRDPLTTGKHDPHPLQRQKVTITPPPEAKPEPETKPVGDAASAELAAVAAELTTQPDSPKQGTVSPKEDAAQPSPGTSVAPPPSKSEEAPKDYVPASTAPVIPVEPEKKQKPLTPELRRQMEEAVKNNPSAPDPEGVVVSGEHGPINFFKVFLWFLAVIVLVVIVGDLLLDAGTITTSMNIPHTHLIK
jgi:hypothetical protein